MIDGGPLVDGIISELEAAADPERLEKAKGYYPTSMRTIGVKVPDQRVIVRRLVKELKGESAEEMLHLAKELVSRRIFECQQVAYEFLSKSRKALEIIGLEDLRDLGQGLDNWISVDTYSTFLAGVAWREGRIPDDVIREWAGSDDRWMRRTAIVSTVALNQKSRGGTGDPFQKRQGIGIPGEGEPDPGSRPYILYIVRPRCGRDNSAADRFLLAGTHFIPGLSRCRGCTRLRYKKEYLLPPLQAGKDRLSGIRRYEG